MDFIPWPSFYERVAASLTSGEQKYQMIVTDSQWLGSFVEGGYYKDLTDDMKNDPELTKIMKDLHPVLVSAYSTYPHQTAKQLEEAGEWPKEGVHYYGFPQFPDTYVTYYRKDLFCNEKEAAKFQETFNQKLPCTYEDWQQVDWDVWAEHRQALPAQEGRAAGRRRGGRRFLRHLLPGGRRLRLLDHAGQRLHLAERRLDLGRDQGP